MAFRIYLCLRRVYFSFIGFFDFPCEKHGVIYKLSLAFNGFLRSLTCIRDAGLKIPVLICKWVFFPGGCGGVNNFLCYESVIVTSATKQINLLPSNWFYMDVANQMGFSRFPL